jgi:hypothetical protein
MQVRCCLIPPVTLFHFGDVDFTEKGVSVSGVVKGKVQHQVRLERIGLGMSYHNRFPFEFDFVEEVSKIDVVVLHGTEALH